MRGRHAAQTVVGVNRLMNPFDPIDQNILRAIEEVQKISNLADRNWKRTADMISTIDFERIVRLTEEQMKVIDRLEEQSKWLSRAGPGAVAVARSNYNRIIDDVLRTIEPTALSLTNASVLAANAALADARWFDSRLSELWAHLPEREQELTDERVDKDLQALNDFIRETLARLPTASWSHFFSIMSVILTVYVAYNANIQQQAMEVRLMDKIEESRASIIEEVQEEFSALEPQAYSTLFVVERKLFLKRGPKSRSRIIGKLYPCQIVSLIEKRGRKVKVSYFDYLAEEPRQGWLLKKDLKRIPPLSEGAIIVPRG